MSKTIIEKAEQAKLFKIQGRGNCCQAVVSVLAYETDFTAEQLFKMASGFGLGIGNMDGSCGALIGACMIVGAKSTGERTTGITKEISENFKKKCGSTICRTIKGIETGKVLCSCPDCVKNAVMAYGEVLSLV